MTDQLRDDLQATLGTAYTLERELGGGGMSRVFLATEAALGRRVVVKVLPPEMAASVSIERFKREIQLAARLQHPHIVPLLAAGELSGLPYFTMPFVDGESLRLRLARQGELPVSEAIRVLREIASALAYAHERGIVHRDIKPDNVLLSGGAAMVTDFGVAKALSASSNAEASGMTSMGVALGTPAYMSPEQASADPTVDHRADIYAFGVLAYELLTGQTPFAGRTPHGLLAAHVTEPPEPITKRRVSIPAGLAALVMRCLEKRPADRPQSAAEIVHALDDLTTPSGGMSPTSALPSTPATTSRRDTTAPPRRRPVVAVGAALVAIALVGVGAFAWRARAGTAVPAPVAGASAAEVRSIAVLALENAAADTATQFFADGMTDELTATVGKLPGLSVASRSATAAAVSAAKGDIKAIGQRLAVASVLGGRIRRSGSRMRLTAELTNVADGRLIWTESYDREVKDAFKVQDEVARAIAGALRVTLAGSGTVLAAHETKSAEAHDLYLRARFLQAKYTEPDLRQSLVLFHQALEKDPAYAQAWSGIADSWGMLADDFIPASDALQQQRESIARGMAIDSTIPELHATLGIFMMWYERDFAAARREMESALRADSRLSMLDAYFPMLLWAVGQRDSSLAFIAQSVKRDPANPDVLGTAIANAVQIGDTTDALRYCGRAEELHVASGYCGALPSASRGDLSSLLRVRRVSAERAQGRSRVGSRLRLVQTLAAMHQDAEARRIADSVASVARGGSYVSDAAIAQMYTALGDVDHTLEWLERTQKVHGSGIAMLYLFTWGTPLEGNPRILAFGRKLGLPDPPPYWRARTTRD